MFRTLFKLVHIFYSYLIYFLIKLNKFGNLKYNIKFNIYINQEKL